MAKDKILNIDSLCIVKYHTITVSYKLKNAFFLMCQKFLQSYLKHLGEALNFILNCDITTTQNEKN